MKRLWTHEVFRVYYDRLVDDSDRKWLVESLSKCMSLEFDSNFDEVFKHLDFNQDGKYMTYMYIRAITCTFTMHAVYMYMDNVYVSD